LRQLRAGRLIPDRVTDLAGSAQVEKFLPHVQARLAGPADLPPQPETCACTLAQAEHDQGCWPVAG